MKIVCVNKNMYTIYLNKHYYQYNKDTMNECIKRILVILKKIYSFEIYSEINIKCYINKYYGIILEIERLFDAYSLYIKKSNVEITYYYDSRFFCKIQDYFIKNGLSNYNIIIFKNNYYIELLDDECLNVIEFIDEILYGEDAKKIIKNM